MQDSLHSKGDLAYDASNIKVEKLLRESGREAAGRRKNSPVWEGGRLRSEWPSWSHFVLSSKFLSTSNISAVWSLSKGDPGAVTSPFQLHNFLFPKHELVVCQKLEGWSKPKFSFTITKKRERYFNQVFFLTENGELATWKLTVNT